MSMEIIPNNLPVDAKITRLQVLQFLFTVITALSAGIWGCLIHASQERNNEAQINIKQQQIKLQEMQSQWQNEFQQNQLKWQTEFQKIQLGSQEQIANNISQLNSITAMDPFIDKITGLDPAKAKMAAYGLYLLHKKNPEMAVTLITATKKEEMHEVLETLGKMDKNIISYIGKFLPRDEVNPDNEQKKLNTVVQNIQRSQPVYRGFCFFGRYIDGRWDKKAMVSSLPQKLPQVGESYTVHRQTYLRSSFPAEQNGDLILSSVLGINHCDNVVNLLDVKHYSNGAVWCELEIVRNK